MANIYKRPRSPFWWISYTTATDRVRVSTGVRHDGRKSPPKDSPVLEIRRTIEERLARARFGAAPMIEHKPVADFLRDYLAGLQGVRHTSLKRYRFMVQAFTGWAKTEQVATVADVTYAVASRYVAFRRAADIGPATLRAEVRFLNSAWAEAKKLHHVEFEENPWTFSFKVERHEPDPFTDAELAAILAQPMPAWLREGLRHAPLAALAAIIAPSVLMDAQGQWLQTWQDARLPAVAVAVAWFLWRRDLLGTILSGTAVMLLLRIGLGW